jgi:helix-turn-helix protein
MVIGVVTREQIEVLGAVAERLEARGLKDEGRMLREVLAQVQSTPREVPASTAAEILRVTPQTVRNWVRGGILPGRQDRTGHFHVSLDALEPTIRLNRLMPNVPEELATISDDEIDAEIQAVRAARRMAAAKE